MIAFLRELKRRKVIRVGSAYIAVGWGLTQIVAEFGEPLSLPDWFYNAFIVIVLAGLPLALLLAWAFEVTPDGVATTQAAAEGAPESRLQVVDFALLGAMVLVVGIVAAGLFREQPARISSPMVAEGPPSIAVLPFLDMSDTGDQAYFSDGMSEEIMNVLAQVEGLKVASRTSSFSFKGSEKSLPEIASVLGVAHVLEGSVRKSGDRIRITAQLIRAEDGFNVWTETYDETLDDVFAIQDDVSKRILEELEILVVGQTAPVAAQRGDAAAFDIMLRAREAASDYSTAGQERAIALYREAIEIDPDYAPAYFDLAANVMLNSDASGGQGDRPAAEALAEAGPILERGRELAPDSPRGWVLLALYRLFQGEFDAAETAFLKAAELQPNIGLNNYAVLLIQQNRVAEALEVLERERELDPTSGAIRTNLVSHYLLTGRREDAHRAAEEALQDITEKGLFSGKRTKAILLYNTGEWAQSIKLYESVLEETPGVQPVAVELGYAYLSLHAYDEASLTGHPLIMLAAMAFSGGPEFPLKQAMGMVDSGVQDARLYYAAIYFAAAKEDWSLIADKLAPRFPSLGDGRGCEHPLFPLSVVAIANQMLERDIATEELLSCWETSLARRRDSGHNNAGTATDLGMWHWFRGDADAAFVALNEAMDLTLPEPFLDRILAYAGLLDDPRGRELLARHYEQVNRERGKLDLEALEVPAWP
ncbi:MAG: hypothetical protein AAFQ62_02575 [Pseudomonadota bacterium]